MHLIHEYPVKTSQNSTEIMNSQQSAKAKKLAPFDRRKVQENKNSKT